MIPGEEIADKKLLSFLSDVQTALTSSHSHLDISFKLSFTFSGIDMLCKELWFVHSGVEIPAILVRNSACKDVSSDLH